MRLNVSAKKLAQYLGVLGILLPWAVWAIHGHQASSISHFYYTNAGVVFTGVLWAFGVFLIAYPGYERTPEEKAKWYFVPDSVITTVAGTCAMGTGFFPTAFDGTFGNLVKGGPNAHENPNLDIFHLILAGVFLILCGYMAIFRFTKSGRHTAWLRRRWWAYVILGSVTWLSLVVLGIGFIIESEQRPLPETFVFWGEVFALTSFGLAWLIKSEHSALRFIFLVGKPEITARKLADLKIRNEQKKISDEAQQMIQTAEQVKK